MSTSTNVINLADYRLRRAKATARIPQHPKPAFSGIAEPHRKGTTRRKRISMAQHLHTDFPAEELLSVTPEGVPIWSDQKIAHRVEDYFSAYGVTMAKNEIPEALNEAWAFLAIEPGHWVDYLAQSPETYVRLRHTLTNLEHSYIRAIASDDRATAAKLFGDTRWAPELKKKLRQARRDLGRIYQDHQPVR